MSTTYYENNKERLKQQARERYLRRKAENPEKIREYSSDYYAKNRKRLLAYSKKYQANSITYKQRQKKKRDKYRQECAQIILEYKFQHPCLACGEPDPVVLQFHHFDPSKKLREVSRLQKQGCVKRLKEEIIKCRILCANCHLREHDRLRNEKSPQAST